MAKERSDLGGVGLPIALLLPIVVGAALVGVRGDVEPAVIALVLACTVVIGARLGGRVGGMGAAVIAALTFDFFHTVPYQSLKIANREDVFVTGLLLVVGVVVGAIAGNVSELRNDEQRRYRTASAVTRVLAVAHDGPLDDVELAVEAELLKVLALERCTLSTAPSTLPELKPDEGYLEGALVAEGGFTLPSRGVAVPVVAYGRRLGALECVPRGPVGIPLANRRIACALGEVLGLALAARLAA